MDMLRLYYEPLLILSFFRDPHDIITKTTFFAQCMRNPSGMIIVFKTFLLIAEVYFGNLFLNPKKVSERC